MKTELRTVLIQLNIEWQRPEVNLANAEGLLHSIEEADLILLPEMFTTGFSMRPDQLSIHNKEEIVNWFTTVAKWKDSYVAGSVIVEDDGKYKNRLILSSPDGVIEYYDKRHLFSLAGEDKQYTCGKEQKVVEIYGWKTMLTICYDLRFPVWSRNIFEYDLLINVANWPNPRLDAWRTLSKARAIENQAYVLACNRSGKDPNNNQYEGYSSIIDFQGNELASSTDENAVVSFTLNKETMDAYREKLPFLKDQDRFTIET